MPRRQLWLCDLLARERVKRFVHTSSTQPLLSTSSAASYFEDRCPCVEMSPWSCSGVSTGAAQSSKEWPYLSTVKPTVCIDWIRPTAQSTDVNRTSKFYFVDTQYEQLASSRSRRQSYQWTFSTSPSWNRKRISSVGAVLCPLSSGFWRS